VLDLFKVFASIFDLFEVVEQDLLESDSLFFEDIELFLHLFDTFFFSSYLLFLHFVLMFECLVQSRDVLQFELSIQFSQSNLVRPVFFKLEQVFLELLLLFV